MHVPTLEALFLDAHELQTARIEIEKMAFCRWQDAGCPLGSDEHFWREAELEWIEYRYVPDRSMVAE